MRNNCLLVLVMVAVLYSIELEAKVIIVKSLTGNEVLLNIDFDDPAMNIEAFKEELSKRAKALDDALPIDDNRYAAFAVPPDTMRIIAQGKQIDDNNFDILRNLPEGSVAHLVTRINRPREGKPAFVLMKRLNEFAVSLRELADTMRQ